MFNRFSVSHSPLSYDMTPAQSDGPLVRVPTPLLVSAWNNTIFGIDFLPYCNCSLSSLFLKSSSEVLNLTIPKFLQLSNVIRYDMLQGWFFVIIWYSMYVTRIYSAIQSIHFCSSFWPSAALLLLHQRHRRQIRNFVQASTASAHGRVKFKALSAFSLCSLLSPCTACRSANGKVVSMPKLLFCWNWLHFEQEKWLL